MMLNKKNNIILIIIFFIILLSIISALIIEYILGHKPCGLCLYERIPYFLSAVLIIKIIFFKKYEKIKSQNFQIFKMYKNTQTTSVGTKNIDFWPKL